MNYTSTIHLSTNSKYKNAQKSYTKITGNRRNVKINNGLKCFTITLVGGLLKDVKLAIF